MGCRDGMIFGVACLRCWWPGEGVRVCGGGVPGGREARAGCWMLGLLSGWFAFRLGRDGGERCEGLAAPAFPGFGREPGGGPPGVAGLAGVPGRRGERG